MFTGIVIIHTPTNIDTIDFFVSKSNYKREIMEVFMWAMVAH